MQQCVLDACRLGIPFKCQCDGYQQLVENLLDGVVITTNQGVIIYANKSMLNIVGASAPSNIYGTLLQKYIHPYFHARVARNNSHALLGGFNSFDTFELVTLQGHLVEVTSCSMGIMFGGERSIQWIVHNSSQVKKMDTRVAALTYKIERMAGEIIAIQEKVSATVAADLHDDVGQLLTALNSNLTFLQNTLGDSVQVTQLQDSKQIIQQIFKVIHQALKALNPTHIDILGLSEAVEGHVYAWRTRHRVNVVLEISKTADYPSPEIAASVFRIVQESLTNISKHAAASNVWVVLKVTISMSPRLILEIKDDGCGFDVDLAQNDDGFGLLGMRLRAEQVGGSWLLTSNIGMGTILRAEFPMVYQCDNGLSVNSG